MTRFMSYGWLVGAVLIAISVTGGEVAAQGKGSTYSWNYASTQPASQLQAGLVIKRWIEELQRRSNGRMKVRLHSDATLVADAEMVDAVVSGVADFGFVNAGYWPANFPLWVSLGTLHDLDLTLKLGPVDQTKVTRRLVQEFPQLAQEFEKRGVKILFVHSSAPHAIVSKEPITTVADLKGKKIRTYGTGIPKMIAAGGGIPVSMPSGEIYSSLQTGAIDGAYSIVDTFRARRLNEVAKHVTVVGNTPLLHLGLTTVMSLDAWRNLPEEDQRILEEVSRETEVWLAEETLKQDNKALETLESRGVTVHHMSKEELEKWRGMLPDLYGEAIAEMNKHGAPGAEFVNELRRIAAEVLAK